MTRGRPEKLKKKVQRSIRIDEDVAKLVNVWIDQKNGEANGHFNFSIVAEIAFRKLLRDYGFEKV